MVVGKETLGRLYITLLFTICAYAVAYLVVFHLLHLLTYDPWWDKMFFYIVVTLLAIVNIIFPWAMEVLPNE